MRALKKLINIKIDMIDLYELETAIKAKFEEITDFVVVYDHYTLKTDWFPYVAFELDNFDWDFADTCSNFTNITFNATILQIIDDETERADAKRIIYKLLNQVINLFSADMTLWVPNIVKGDVLKWEMWTVLWEFWQCLAINISIKLQENNFIK